MKLIIQIPCYNEADTLEIVLNELPKKIEGIDKIDIWLLMMVAWIILWRLLNDGELIIVNLKKTKD